MVPLNSVRGSITGVDLSELDTMAQEYDNRGGQAKPTTKQQTYKYKVTKGGKTIFSADGQSWFDEKGNAIK